VARRRANSQYRKHAAQSRGLKRAIPGAEVRLPFNAIESRFLVGLAFRLTLRDIIFSSQLRHNQGVLETTAQEIKTLGGLQRNHAVFPLAIHSTVRQTLRQGKGH
jgi:hypothetical protein